MLSAYNRRLVIFYLSNAVSHIRCHPEAAKNLREWLLKHENELKFRYPRTPDGETANTVGDGSRVEKVPTLEWERLSEALRSEFAAARQARPDCAARRLRSLARAVRLSRTDIAILELLLRSNTVALVESMLDDIGGRLHRNWFRLGNPVLPSLLGLSPGAVYRRFAPAAPLVTSGLVSIENDGDVSVIDRLTRLHWLPKEAGSDVPSLLLDRASPGDLRWSDFDHVAGDRDHLEQILNGALRTGRKGVNVLVYGPPGDGQDRVLQNPGRPAGSAALRGRRIGCRQGRTFSPRAAAGAPARPTSACRRPPFDPAFR